jgi:hypothetical protein
VFVRGENLLDEDYTEVFSYRSPGRAGYLGLRARLYRPTVSLNETIGRAGSNRYAPDVSTPHRPDPADGSWACKGRSAAAYAGAGDHPALRFVWMDEFDSAEQAKLTAWIEETHAAVVGLVGPVPHAGGRLFPPPRRGPGTGPLGPHPASRTPGRALSRGPTIFPECVPP